MAVNPKVTAAASSAGLSGAVATIVLWIISSQDVDVPPEVAAAITTIIAAIFAFVGGYFRSSS